MNTETKQTTGKRILFANFPAEGHFNPLTGLAIHLLNLGYDVRWYCSSGHLPKLKKLHIPHYPFKKAIDVNGGNFDEIFPGRTACKTAISKLKFDIIHAFVLRAPEYYADIKDIYGEFPFDLLVADCAFTGAPFVKELMNIPVVSIGIFPLTESSKDLPPNGLGIEPSYTFFGKIKQALMRGFANKVVFNEPNKVLHHLLDRYNINHNYETVFDMLINKSNLLLQSGSPGFEYQRSDMSGHIKFIGPLLPHKSNHENTQWFDNRLNQYKQIILVTQGTVERDINKIIVPTLEAFKDTDTLVVCTTGGSQTNQLKSRYLQPNIIIEDFIPFDDVMPYADVYITNGGYGGVMLGIENRLPLVVAGVHEGKNEICARVGYFKLGINLKTERPTPQQIRNAVEKIFSDQSFKENAEKLATEFSLYNPDELCAKYIRELLQPKISTREKVYPLAASRA